MRRSSPTRPLLVVFLLVAVAGGLLASAPVREGRASEPADAPAIEFEAGVPYGRGGETPLLLDLARPTRRDGPLAGVLIFHGGGWVEGHRGLHADLVRRLARAGYFAASVSYRLAIPLRSVHPWPAQIEDAKCAVRWLRAHSETWGVDPERIGAVGFSAGGQLAMLLGTIGPEDGLEGAGGWHDQDSRVQAVVSFSGPTDMGTYTTDPDVVRGLDLAGKRRLARGVALGLILGDEFRRDPSRASPLRYVSSGDAAMLLVHGTRDRLVPYGDAQLMVDALTEAYVPGEVVFKIGLGHGWKEPDRSDGIEQALRFLDRRLRPGQRRPLAPLAR